MNDAQFDLVSLELSECIDGYLKHIANPDVDSVVRMAMAHIVEQFNPSKQEYWKLIANGKSICTDRLRASGKMPPFKIEVKK
jgi:hypothetical protein